MMVANRNSLPKGKSNQIHRDYLGAMWNVWRNWNWTYVQPEIQSSAG